MIDEQKPVREFCQRYGAEIRPSRQKFYHSLPIKYTYNSTDYMHVEHGSSPGVEITMSQENFSRLMSFNETLESLCRDFQNYYKDYGHSGKVSWLDHKIDQEIKDKQLRKSNPILNDLWEQYSNMKELITSGNRP
jgi:hypothetical protein